MQPANIYGTADPAEQRQILSGHETQFSVSQLISLAGILVMANGYGVFALSLRGRQAAPLIYGGAAAFVLADVSVALALLPAFSDPITFLASRLNSPLIAAFAWLTVAGFGFWGLIFLRERTSRWLGWITLGASALAAIGIVLNGAFVVELLYLVALVTGIVLALPRHPLTA